MSGTEAIERGLEQVPLLAALTRRQRAWLARRASLRRYGTGDVIVRQGDTSMTAYVVLSGAVRVLIENAGRRTVAGDYGAGAAFGEMGALDDAPRSATVVALEPTACALLARWDLERMVRSSPAFALSLIRTVNGRLRGRDAHAPGTDGDTD
jgi:CRP/FNR family transcriptional regulator, cyclic AMP receptor protein